MKRHNALFFLLLLLTCAVLGFLLWRPALNRVARGFLTSELSARLEASVTIGAVGVSLFPPMVRVDDVSIVPREGPLKLISLRSLSIRPGAVPIFLGKIVIRQIRVEEPLVELQLEGARSEPRSPRRRFELPSVRDLLKIEIDEVFLADARLLIGIPVADLVVSLGFREAGFLSSGDHERWNLSGKAELRKGDRALPFRGVSLRAGRRGERVEIEALRLEGLGAQLDFAGTILPDLDGKLSFSGDLGSMVAALTDLSVLSEVPDIDGRISVEASTGGVLMAPDIAGTIKASGLRAGQNDLPGLGVSFDVIKGRFGNLDGLIEEGRDRVSFSAKSRDGDAIDISLEAKSLSLGSVFRWADPDGATTMGGSLDFWLRGRAQFDARAFSGRYSVETPYSDIRFEPHLLRFLPIGFRDVAASGAIEWDVDRGLIVRDGAVTASGLEGAYSFSVRPGMVQGSWNVAVSDLGGVFAADYGLRGSGRVGGGIFPSGDQSEVLLDLDIDSLGLGDLESMSVVGKIFMRSGLTRLEDFRLSGGPSELSFSGWFPSHDISPMRIEGYWRDLPLEWFSRVVSRRYPVTGGISGIGSGDLFLEGFSRELTGRSGLKAEDLRWRGKEFYSADVEIDVDKGGFVFKRAAVSGEGMEANVSGVLTATEFRSFRLEADKVPAALLSVPPFLDAMFTSVDIALSLDGDARDPQVKGRAEVFRRDEGGDWIGVGAARVSGPLSYSDWSTETLDGTLKAQGRLDMAGLKRFSGSGRFESFPLSPFLEPSGGSVTASWELGGDLNNLKTFSGSIDIEALDLGKDEWKVGLSGPVRVPVETGAFRLPEVVLKGTSTELRLSGSLNLNGLIEGRIEGQADLGLVTLAVPILQRAEGVLRISGKISGENFRPGIDGAVEVRRGLLQFRDIAQPVENVLIEARLSRSQIVVDRLEGSIGGGTIRGRGQVELGTDSDAATMRMFADLSRLDLRTPPWMPSAVSGTLALLGPLRRPLLTGDILVHRVTYRDEWDWKSQILTFGGRALSPRVAREEEERLRFDVLFRSEGDVIAVSNNVAEVTLRGDIRLLGSGLKPGMVGKLEIAEGNVTFLDNRFELSSGLIRFTDESAVRAVFDVTGRTRVQDTDIILDIRSRENRVEALLSSQPPRDETNLIALLTLGVDYDTLVQADAAGSSLSASLVPSVLSGPIQSGIERTLKQARILDTLQFVPHFSESTKTSGLRMIVGKDVVRNVRLLYSTDLFEVAGENTIKLEKRFNRHISAQGGLRINAQDAQNEVDLGLDLEFGFEF